MDDQSNQTNSRVCRICLEKDDLSMLISPCLCKGSIKYVHPHCLSSWRCSLMQRGRCNELYHCSLCKQRLQVRQRRLWVALLQYRAMRIALTAFLVILAHIPAGAIMKLFILFSVHIANHPGGLYDMIPSGSLLPALLSATQSSFLTKPLFALPLLPESPHRVLYTPFPVCFRSSPDNDLFNNELLYWLFYPFADERLWRLLLCRLEHFHLGFFFLGSVNNIYFTYRTLNDMFDLVMLSQADEPNEFEWLRRRFGPFLKNFLLTYCCALVLLFWIHFNLYAFQVDSTDTMDFSSRRFLAELPLWTLRWITLGVAVIDFGTRRVYRWLTRLASRIDEEEVISIQVED